MTDSGKLLRNVSVATALCATAALLAACGSARAATAGYLPATHSASASTGGTRTAPQKPVDPRAWLIPGNVVSIRVIAQPGWGSTIPPGRTPPARQIATVSDRSKVGLVAHQLNTLPFGAGPLPCPSGDGAYLELDFYSAGHPKSPSATAIVNHLGCNGVLLSDPGRHFLTHQGSVFNQVLKELGLTFPTR
jgi:hypothetical protein